MLHPPQMPSVPDFVPPFRRYDPAVVDAIGRIERARGIIDSAQVLPAQEDILRRDALVGSVHFSNLIEGNELPLIEALRAVDEELAPTDKSKLELVNYVEALKLIERRQQAGAIAYTPDFLKELHGVMTKGLGRPSSDGRGFQPHHEGEWRDGQVIVGDALAIYHMPPSKDDVPSLMEARLDWLERKRTSDEYPVPIIAAVAHFEVAEVHPFADYNGRAARLFETAIFFRENFIARRLFSPERFYAENRDAYFAALRTYQRTHNLNDWLPYYVQGLAQEFERVAERVQQLNRVTESLPQPIQLTPVQEQAVADLTTGAKAEIRIGAFATETGIGRDRVSDDLNELANLGILRAEGTTRNRVFKLRRPRATAGTRTTGRPQTWDETRIRAELAALVAEVGGWPARKDFDKAGKIGLYVAMSRYGGVRRWRREFGY
jgi:Fic family protein